MAKNWEAEHNARTVLYSKQVETIYATACQEAANIGATISGFNADKPFTFADYPLTQNRIEKLTSGLGSSVEAVIVNGITAEWKESNFKSDELAKSILGYAYKGKDFKKVEQYQKYFNNNDKALAAFIARKDAGLALSDKVWFYTSKFKNEIELGLDLGLRSGKSAAEMARDLKQYLKEPDKLFRRVKDQHGILHLSKAAKNYHPSQGVYRSSYKNALRLSITETNMAYRAAEHERLQQLDFIVGIEVQVSKNNHPVNDICDNLKGLYPKDFKFVGWHPHCRCHTITILKTDKEILADDKLIAAGGEPSPDSVNKIDTPPAGWHDWLDTNKERIATAKEKGTLPYFLKDNPAYAVIPKSIEPQGFKLDKQAIAKLTYTGWIVEKQLTETHYSKIMGEFDLVQLDKEFTEIFDSNGLTIKSKKINTGYKSNMVELNIAGDDFRLIREFRLSGNKRIVEHSYLVIPDAKQGSGISRDLFKSLYTQYKNAKINRIEVHANINIGGYTWARYGFSASKSDAIELLNSKSNYPFYKQAKQKIDDYFTLHKNKDEFPMMLWVNEQYGKEMLLGSDWSGFINLSDAAQRQMFEDYLFSR